MSKWSDAYFNLCSSDLLDQITILWFRGRPLLPYSLWRNITESFFILAISPVFLVSSDYPISEQGLGLGWRLQENL